MKNATTDAIDAAKKAFTDARADARKNPTPENREAAIAAWAALEAATPRRAIARYGSRAGQRQAAWYKASR